MHKSVACDTLGASKHASPRAFAGHSRFDVQFNLLHGGGVMSARLPPVIVSLLDTDLYKFTMLQAFLHQQPAATGEYRFTHRSGGSLPLADIRDEVAAQIDSLCSLRLTPPELAYLR